jgi:small subunit ribosomal protein S21
MKRKMKKNGMMEELRERQHYMKPSEKRREAKKRGIARRKKEQRIAENNR